MLLLNLKTYPEATGSKLPEVLAAIKQVNTTEPRARDLVYLGPQLIDLNYLRKIDPSLNLFAPVVHGLESGAGTGKVTAERLLDAGVSYALLNHSENRVATDELMTTLDLAQSKGLKLVVCCENMQEAAEILARSPFAIAYEPKDLIGSGKSVSSEQPEIVREFIELVKTNPQVKAIIGAGITSEADIKIGLKLGAQGFLVASAFTKAEDKAAKLLELINPYLS